MKKIKLILLALVAGLVLTSCFDDDPVSLFPVQGLSDIALTVSSSNNVTGEGVGIPFTANIPQIFTQDVMVQAQLDFEGGRVNSTVAVPTGSTSVSGTITMPSNPESKFSGQTAILSLNSLALADQSQAFNVTSNEIIIQSFDRVQWPYGASVIAGRMTALFDWTDPINNDLDMYIFSEANEQVESSTSGSRWETDIFNDTHLDGKYFVLIDLFIASGDIPWRLFFVNQIK